MFEAILVMALLALAIHFSPVGNSLHELRAQTTKAFIGQNVVSLASPSCELKEMRPVQTRPAPLRLREMGPVRAATRLRARRPRGRYPSGIPP